MRMKKLSVVIPVYNGAKTIGPLVDQVCKTIVEYDLEIVLVNDGSGDDSEEVCSQIAISNQAVKCISLRKNFGEHNAVMCGLNHMTGDAVAIIDDDFQNPPSEILKLVHELEKGYDVVYSFYGEKHHHWFRNLGSRFHNCIATLLLKKPKDLYLSTFKAISKEMVQEIIKYRGPFPYIDGLIFRTTRNISSVLVIHAPRAHGESNYTLRKLISIWLNMFLNFSIAPLRIFTLFGIGLLILGSILAVGTVIEKLVDPTVPLGHASIFVALIVFSGAQIIFLGLIGEYLGKQYLDQNLTPQWSIKRKVPEDKTYGR